MFSKKILLPVLATAVIGGVVVYGVGVAQVHAQDEKPLSGLVQALVQKFSLNESQVQTVVDDFVSHERQTRLESMQKREEDRLTKLVAEGKITDAQKQAILNELAALRSTYNPENMKDKTAAERKAQMQAMHDELQAWAKQQGIDLKYVMVPMGMKGHMKRTMMSAPTSSPTP